MTNDDYDDGENGTCAKYPHKTTRSALAVVTFEGISRRFRTHGGGNQRDFRRPFLPQNVGNFQTGGGEEENFHGIVVVPQVQQRIGAPLLLRKLPRFQEYFPSAALAVGHANGRACVVQLECKRCG